VLKELQGLTQIEEMLIARALSIMKVYIKPGGQRGYSGHCINLPQKTTELAQTLPRYPKDVPLIIVTMKGKDNSFKDVIVRKEKVEKALLWLIIEHNPQYQFIKLDTNSLQNLPINGVPNDVQTINTVDDITINEEKNDSDLDVHSDDEQVYDKNTQTSSFLPQSHNNKLEKDEIQNEFASRKINWPSIENEPLNEYTTLFLATMAFPTLFPDGRGDPNNPYIQRDVTFSNRIQHLLKFAENVDGKWMYRFETHPRFSYWALNMIQRKRALQQNSIFLKQNPGEAHITIDELRNMTSNNNSTNFMSKLSRYVANISGSNAYWHKIREDLKAIISYKEAPTIFFTFSSADMHWPELHSLFDPNNDHLTNEQKINNVTNNPHLVDCFFTKRFESFIKHWLYETLNAEWHWYRYEFQARGSIHCHGTAKLKNDPGLCKLTEIALKVFFSTESLAGIY
jgi:hypothetical protein